MRIRKHQTDASGQGNTGKPIRIREECGGGIGRCGCRGRGRFFRGAFGDDAAAAFAAFGTHVNYPVGGFDDVEVVLNDEEGVAGGAELEEDVEELGDVVEMEAGGRLVKPFL
jgi:hypothetical protein